MTASSIFLLQIRKCAFINVSLIVFFAEVQTLDTIQALCLPLGASISLLVMFFFFDSMQMLFAICTASKCIFIYLIFRRMTNLFTLFGPERRLFYRGYLIRWIISFPYFIDFFYNTNILIYLSLIVIATVALAFLLLPMCQYIVRPCSDGTK